MLFRSNDILADLVAKSAERDDALRQALFIAAIPLQRKEQMRRVDDRQGYVLDRKSVARLSQLAIAGKRT